MNSGTDKQKQATKTNTEISDQSNNSRKHTIDIVTDSA